MPFEVDFLPVGDGERSGDAFAFRFGNLSGPRAEQKVCVIDGGTKESGKALVRHVQQFFGTNEVDFVFCSHPDSDHASGLTEVLDGLSCKTLVMHRPWEHSEDIHHLFDDPKLTPEKLAGRMEKNLVAAHDLEKLALNLGMNIVEPFEGATDQTGSIRVLGPSKAYYQSLLVNFRDMPELAEESSFKGFLKSLADTAVTWIDENLDLETLSDPDPDDVSAENNSSTIILFTIEGQKLLFTGDAGPEALARAADYAASLGIALDDLYLLQGPHHGIKRNVGPTILNRIKAKSAFVSAGKEAGPKHPSKRVTNALHRRGAATCVTAGNILGHISPGWPVRPGWVTAPVVPFYPRVEAD